MQMTIAVREPCLVQSAFDKEARSIFRQAYSLNWEYCIRPVGMLFDWLFFLLNTVGVTDMS